MIVLANLVDRGILIGEIRFTNLVIILSQVNKKDKKYHKDIQISKQMPPV